MTVRTGHHQLLIGWISLAVALLFYLTGLGSDHLATNGDELLYAQIARLTAATGHLLPLQSVDEHARNTKPPLLFWQGILSTGWGGHWHLALLRLPNVLYTLLTAEFIAWIARRRTRSLPLALQAALLFLCFFSTYRYGRVFLTSAPETFWLFLPLALLLLHREPEMPAGAWRPWLYGGLIGVGLLYKSFALLVPVILTMGLWQLSARGWRVRPFLTLDAWRLLLAAVSALLVFSLWFWFDPDPSAVVKDFVLRENAGKFNTGGENYFLNLVWGQSSIWRILVSYPLDAGLLALPTAALAVDAWNRRRHLGHLESLLWIWMLVLAAFFCIPNQRDERYLLPAMPALALLLAMRLGHLPQWLLRVTVACCGIILLGLAGLAILLQSRAGIGPLYPVWLLPVLAAMLAVILVPLLRSRLPASLLPLQILLVYLGYTLFLLPLDHGPGLFAGEGVEAVAGRDVAAPINFNAREESYGFLLPEAAAIRPYWHTLLPTLDEFIVVSLPLDQPPPDGIILARRLNMIDRFDAAETRDILSGNITHHLFHWDWLVQRK